MHKVGEVVEIKELSGGDWHEFGTVVSVPVEIFNQDGTTSQAFVVRPDRYLYLQDESFSVDYLVLFEDGLTQNWIEHTGGKMPIGLEWRRRIQVLYEDGGGYTGQAGDFIWEWDKCRFSKKIVKYMFIAKEAS